MTYTQSIFTDNPFLPVTRPPLDIARDLSGLVPAAESVKPKPKPKKKPAPEPDPSHDSNAYKRLNKQDSSTLDRMIKIPAEYPTTDQMLENLVPETQRPFKEIKSHCRECGAPVEGASKDFCGIVCESGHKAKLARDFRYESDWQKNQKLPTFRDLVEGKRQMSRHEKAESRRRAQAKSQVLAGNI